MKTIVTIAVRMKSVRLPRKAMADIAGQSMISHLIERVQQAKVPQAVILCTSCLLEDAVLIEEAEKFGISCIAGDPDDVFQRFLEAASREKADHVVRVTGDNPLTDATYIDRLIQKHLARENEYTTVEGLPLGTASEVISVTALKRARAVLEHQAESEYMTFLVNDPRKYKVGILMADATLRRPHYRLTVDTSADLELIRLIYKKLFCAGGIFSLADVVAFLDANPDLSQINNEIQQRRLR